MRIKFSKIFPAFALLFLAIFSCDDMDSIHDQYLNGEKIYAGKLDSLKTFSGFKRVKIVGLSQYLGNSNECTVTWDDQTQIFQIDQINDGTFEMIVDNLDEKGYEFDILTKDPSGNNSVLQTVRGRAVGDIFKNNQSPRRLIQFEYDSDKLIINWADKEESEYVVYTLFKYETQDGTMAEALVYPNDVLTVLENWKPLGKIEIVSSVISGDNGFDVIDLDMVENALPEAPPSGLNKDWTLAATIKVSKEFFGGRDGAEGSPKVIDGDIFSKYLILDFPSDFWMQQELPVEGIVDFYTLTSGNDAPGRDPKNWELVGSNDEVSWVTLDTRTDESFADRNVTNEYTFENETPYKYYRMNITSISGDPHFQLSEWRLFERDVPQIDLTGFLLNAITVSKDFPDGPEGAEGSLKLVDGDTNSKFLIFDYPTDFWMQQEFLSEAIANQYTLTSGNDAPSRDPKDWTLAGSNDETNWVTLDTRSGESFGGRNETKEYTFNSDTAYKYYRLNITSNNGDGLFQLSEWRLLIVK